MNKLKALWGALPAAAQAAIVSCTVAAISTFVHAASEGNCFTRACLKHYATAAVVAGLVALRVFFMVPNNKKNGAPPAPPVTPATA